MDKRISAIFQSRGFYVSLAVALAAVGIGGYFLLMDRTEPVVETATPVYETVTDTLPEGLTQTARTNDPVEEDPAPAAPVQVLETASMPEDPIEPEAPAAVGAVRTVVQPLTGEVVAAFSVDSLIYDPTLADWRIHDGVDIAAELDAEVFAAAAGVVAAVRDDAMMGTTVVIQHEDGYTTTYSNLRAGAEVLAGDHVAAGQVIGAVGDTAAAESARGPHLHFSVTQNGDVVDPEVFLAQ